MTDVTPLVAGGENRPQPQRDESERVRFVWGAIPAKAQVNASDEVFGTHRRWFGPSSRHLAAEQGTAVPAERHGRWQAHESRVQP
jgi:hypothetical protein